MSRRPELAAIVRDLGDAYEIVSELGRGGTSTVYLARDVAGERDVAIKVIRSSHLDDAEAAARLEREARILERLDHPRIVRLLDTHQLEDGRLVLVMAFVQGRTLKQMIRDGGPLPLRAVETILLDVAAALEHAAAHGVVHRDVKPENIFVDDEGRAVLSDFGIARVGRTTSTLTLTGAALGTPAYMAPEQIDGGTMDGRTDLYSLGMTAYEMLTGRTPWAGDNLYTVIYKQKHAELPSLRELRPDTPPHLLRAVSGLTRKHPVARWNSAHEFRVQLEHGIAASASASVPAVPSSRAALTVVTEDSPTLRFVRPGQRGTQPAASGESEERSVAGVAAATVPAPRAAALRDAAPLPPSESDVLAAQRRVARARPTQAGRARRRRRALITALALVIVASGATVAMIIDRNASRFDDEIAAPTRSAANGGTASSAEFPTAPALDGLAPADTGTLPDVEPSATPVRMSIVTGDGQKAVAGDVLTSPIAVRVDDENGNPVTNARVVFRVVAGGGNVAPAEALTDSRGRAAAAWALGTTAGSNQLSVSVRGARQPGVRISATGLPGDAARIVVADGDDRAGSAPSRRVAFRVEDRNGNPVAGAAVTVRVAAGGGAVEPSSMATPATGEARTTWILGSDTANRIVASVDGTDIRVEYAPPPFRLAVRPVTVAGGTHSCSLAGSGAARCWGGNDQGQLGAGRTSRQDGAVRVLATTPVARIAAGISHSCVLDVAGAASCWGLNTSGQLGTGDRNAHPAPATVAGTARFLDISAGLAHTCALAEGGAALCWGEGENGQTGQGATVDRTGPTAIAGGHTFSLLTAGWRHTCALTPQNTAWCWGSNADGQLGDGSTSMRTAPVRVAGGLRFGSLSAGAAHTCGVTVEGEAYCWGQNTHGQIGRFGSGSREPVAVSAPTAFASVSAGAVHTCALTRGGEALCWGRNNFGQLGNESTTDSSEPVRVAGGLRFSSLSSSGSHTCGRTTSGQDYCWGYNVEGQIGDGTRTNRSRPVRVGSSD